MASARYARRAIKTCRNRLKAFDQLVFTAIYLLHGEGYSVNITVVADGSGRFRPKREGTQEAQTEAKKHKNPFSWAFCGCSAFVGHNVCRRETWPGEAACAEMSQTSSP